MRRAGRLSAWSLLFLLDAILAAGKLWASDCNQNGIPDEEDLEPIFKLDAPKVLSMGGTTTAMVAVDLDGDADVDLGSADGKERLLVGYGPDLWEYTLKGSKR
jgi:hypothetical protein